MSEAPATSAELVARHRPEILSYLVRLLGDREEAEDACQEACLRAHRAFTRLRPGSNSRAWLYRIATNSARNAARGRARRTARTVAVDLDSLPGRAPAAEQRV